MRCQGRQEAGGARAAERARAASWVGAGAVELREDEEERAVGREVGGAAVEVAAVREAAEGVVATVAARPWR
jgi:hypothetical protein